MNTNSSDYWEKFWVNRSNSGSQNDLVFQKISHEKIYEKMKECERLLVIGCGDGDGIELYGKKALEIVGIDFSASAIRKSRSRFKQHAFYVSDITDTKLGSGNFDAIISERCITNLVTPESQLAALNEVNRLLTPDGTFYLCEPTLSGYDQVDDLRTSLGLPVLKRHWHNLLFDDDLISRSGMHIARTQNFGIYTLISRIIHPLYVYPDEPKFDGKMNTIAYEMCKVAFNYGVSLPSQHTLYTIYKVQHHG
jgi:SAM-dependent methyltransferase